MLAATLLEAARYRACASRLRLRAIALALRVGLAFAAAHAGSIVLNDSQVVAFAFADEFLFEHLALVFHHAEILFQMPIQQHFECPGSRENLAIFHGGPVNHRVRTSACPALYDVECIAVVITARVEPCRMRGVVIEIGNIDD
jgi:hypothetical protein